MDDVPPKPPFVEAVKLRRAAPLLHLGHPEGSHTPFFELPREASPTVRHKLLPVFALLGFAAAFLAQYLEHLGAYAPTPDVALIWALPFIALLACIAAMPFVAPHFWEHHYHHVSLALAAVVAAYYLLLLRLPGGGNGGGEGGGGAIAKSLGEYFSFVLLLGSLFIASGGILIRVRARATPAVNTTLLLTGAIIANIFGTTGAAMLLIRPYLRINKGHLHPYHIVFFIFIVANVGGSLTPIGDPPLFLGYIKGVPFWWVAAHCWPMWLVAVGALLALFFIFDVRAQRKEHRAPHDSEDLGPVISIYGVSNLLLVFVILAGVILHEDLHHWVPLPWRELIMVAAAALSLWTTPDKIHQENVFNFAPIKEVALLFAGIFVTMVPALNYLALHARDPAMEAALHTPGQYYFACGGLSAILDNAPTYMTFLETELARLEHPEVAALIAQPQLNGYLVAISLGAVFFGAMTYIGNGPNFMVKSIAEAAARNDAGHPSPVPSFFGYIFRYALPILLPVLILIWALFLRR